MLWIRLNGPEIVDHVTDFLYRNCTQYRIVPRGDYEKNDLYYEGIVFTDDWLVIVSRNTPVDTENIRKLMCILETNYDEHQYKILS